MKLLNIIQNDKNDMVRFVEIPEMLIDDMIRHSNMMI